MKKIVLFFSALIVGTSSILAASTVENKVAERNAYRFNDSFIFVEGGITFSVYPDGEFDFYIDNYINGRRNAITFNSGFDYNPYVQYDDYGAVIQVENIPVFYDFYGRVTQIGDVDIRYRNNRVRRVGGMVVFYNNRGFYDYHTGFINVYNRYYVYRPFHAFFARPAIGFCLVYNRPYRRFYTPIRYTYYRPYRFNQRRAFARIGREHRFNNVRRERATIYRNDKRVAVREVRRSNSGRSNRNVATANSKRGRNAQTVQRTNRSRSSATNSRANTSARYNRSNNSVASRSNGNRTKTVERRNVKRNDSKATKNRSVAQRSSRQNTVATRSVSRTPKSTTVTRSRSTTYKAPKQRTVKRSSRATTPTKSRSTVSRSSSSRSSAKASSSRSSRSSNSRATQSRSSRRQ